MPNFVDLDRLLSQLLVSTIQSTNNALYQVIKQLIVASKQLQTEVNSLSSSSGAQGLQGLPGSPGQSGLLLFNDYNENDRDSDISILNNNIILPDIVSPIRERTVWALTTPNLTTVTPIGLTYANSGVAPVNGTETNSSYLSYATAASINSVSAVSSTVFVQPQYGGTFIFKVRTGPSISALNNIFIGLFQAAAGLTGNTPTNNGAIAFRYSTTASDGGWVGFTQQTGAGAPNTVSGTVAPIVINTDYILTITILPGGATALFTVDGSPPQTITTTFPAAATNLIMVISICTSDGVSKAIKFNRLFATTP